MKILVNMVFNCLEESFRSIIINILNIPDSSLMIESLADLPSGLNSMNDLGDLTSPNLIN